MILNIFTRQDRIKLFRSRARCPQSVITRWDLSSCMNAYSGRKGSTTTTMLRLYIATAGIGKVHEYNCRHIDQKGIRCNGAPKLNLHNFQIMLIWNC
ncbi:unnamed protein product [Rhizophagus irregularis]|nr:unnamed protein product [Rhizophagus irregularis]